MFRRAFSQPPFSNLSIVQDMEKGGISDRADDAVDILSHLGWSCK